MTKIIAWIVSKLGITSLTLEIAMAVILASTSFLLGYQVESWRRDSADLKELQDIQKENDKLRSNAIKYETDLSNLRIQNDKLQDDAHKAPSDPVCGNKSIPAQRLSILKKA